VLVTLLLVVAPAQAAANDTCKVPDVSGFWQGFFHGNINQGEVQLFVTQDHRRFHLQAFANGAIFAQGDGTISASGQSSFTGDGPPLIRHIEAKGFIVGDCVATSAQFDFIAIYADGTQDKGTVDLPLHVPGGGDGGT